MPLDLDPIRKRLEQTESLFWENDCKDLDDASPQDVEFIAAAPGDIAALLAEVGSLRAELATAKAETDELRQNLWNSLTDRRARRC